jgi:hypothetical protein
VADHLRQRNNTRRDTEAMTMFFEQSFRIGFDPTAPGWSSPQPS